MNVSGVAVGWMLLLEFVWLVCLAAARAKADPLDPVACVDLGAAVALWPAIRISFQRRPVRGLLAAQVLLAYPVLEAMAHVGRCLSGHLNAIERAFMIASVNFVALIVFALFELGMRVRSRSRVVLT